MSVALIAARSENDVIGHGGKIPWHLPADLTRHRMPRSDSGIDFLGG